MSTEKLKKTNKVALFFNYNVPHAIGHYVKSCFKQVCQIDVLLPGQANRLQPNSHDLYFCIDDGTHYIFPQKLKPSAVWLIDTHTGYSARLIMARQFDHVFASCKKGAEKLVRNGISNTKWVPLACDPVLHGKKQLPKKYDVAFIGSDSWGRRKKLLDKIRSKFSNSYIGLADHTDIGKIYSQAKIVFNCSIINDLNMRVFEGLCSGSCVVTNADVFGQEDLFENKQHLLTYDTDEQAIDLVEYYLNHDQEREEIASAGMQKALAGHTYWHKVQNMLSVIYDDQNVRQDHRSAMSVKLDTLFLRIVETVYKIKYKFLRKFC